MKQTVTVAITTTQEDERRVLLLQRNPNAYPGSGYVDLFPYFFELVGGHVESGEEPVQTAIREVREETGIVIDAQACRLVEVSPFRCNGEPARNWLYCVSIPQELPVVLSQEHLASAWVSMGEAQGTELAFKHSQHLQKVLSIH